MPEHYKKKTVKILQDKFWNYLAFIGMQTFTRAKLGNGFYKISVNFFASTHRDCLSILSTLRASHLAFSKVICS